MLNEIRKPRPEADDQWSEGSFESLYDQDASEVVPRETFGWQRVFVDRPKPDFMKEMDDLEHLDDYERPIYGKILRGLLHEVREGEISEDQLLATLQDFNREFTEKQAFERRRWEDRVRVWEEEHPGEQNADDTDYYLEQYDIDEEGDIKVTQLKNVIDDRYFDRKLILETLTESGIVSEKSIKQVLEMVKSPETTALYKNEIAEFFSKTDPDGAGRSLLKDLQASKDSEQRQGLAKILYRLELGQLGISREGVEYLGRLYDLGEYNNPDFFAKRLTGDGNVGIFDGSHRLARYFNLGDLSSEEAVVRAQVLEFTRDTLFVAKDDGTPEERARRQAVLNEFQKRYSEVYSDQFLKDTGVHFNNLTFREQAWYLYFVESADDETRSRAKQLVARYGEDGLRTFLSMEQNEVAGDTILEIGEKIPERAARTIFVKYGDVVDSVSRAERVLTEVFPEAGSEVLDRVVQNLMIRAKDLLMNYSSSGDQRAAEEILHELSQINTEVLLFAGTIRAATKERDFSVEDFVSRSIEIRDTSQLPEKEKQKLMEVFIKSREQQGGFSEDVLREDIEEFRNLLKEPGHELRVLKQGGEIAAFIRFDRLKNGNIFAGSFTLAPEAKGTAIAIAMARTSIDELNRDHSIEALCYANNRTLLAYYKRMLGFKEAGRIDEETPDRELVKLILSRRAGNVAEAQVQAAA